MSSFTNYDFVSLYPQQKKIHQKILLSSLNEFFYCNQYADAYESFPSFDKEWDNSEEQYFYISYN